MGAIEVHDREYDVFVSHATEDKDAVVPPLAHALQEHSVSVWFDEFELMRPDPKDRPEMLGGIGVEKYSATVRDRGIGEQRRTGRPVIIRWAASPR